jgi:hypothetical protein
VDGRALSAADTRAALPHSRSAAGLRKVAFASLRMVSGPCIGTVDPYDVAVITAVGLASLRTDIVRHYPDLAVLRTLVRAGDWVAVSAFFGRLPAGADRSRVVRAVAETKGSERFLQRVVDVERDCSLARTLLGARLIVIGWKARGTRRARQVSRAQWRVFYDYLRRAERVLADATAIDPGNAAAWTERVTVARGLGLRQAEGRRRYERAAEHCDAPYGAQWQLLQSLCPKWGGSLEAVHAFARDCLRSARPGTLSGAVVADAHVEHAFTFDHEYHTNSYLGQEEVREALRAAASQTVLHPAFQPAHGWVEAHSAFAFTLFRAGDYESAAPHFAALGMRVHAHPWDVLDSQWKVSFLRASRKVRTW